MSWPRLTEIPGKRHPSLCQSCGDICDLARWQEHDDRDKPERRYVVLCVKCSGKLIEPHPRLYRELQHWEPMPGTMEICADCTFRAADDLGCTHPNLKANGGPGLLLNVSHGFRGFIDGKDYSGPFIHYNGPSSCTERKTA